MAKADGLLPKFLHFQTKIKYTEDHNIEVQLENVTDHDWVDVVRCGECLHRTNGWPMCKGRPKDWFCADGWRREST